VSLAKIQIATLAIKMPLFAQIVKKLSGEKLAKKKLKDVPKLIEKMEIVIFARKLIL
jgi:hypothetical protein